MGFLFAAAGGGVHRSSASTLHRWYPRYTVGTNLDEVTPTEAYKATAYSVAERLIDEFDKTNEYWAYV